ncbi:NADP-dependent 3-hydroxy acid dehydrogenase YdfG [Sphingobium faniae]|nr:NADP-dependent 3-hydroxy acid dehydrogenase YdfG [Sphingobium faniae]
MRTLLVTGAAGGVGGALAARLARRGDRVFACARSTTQLKDLASERIIPLEMDVSDSASVERAFAELDRQLGGQSLDAIVHCAAIAPLGTVEFTPPEEYGRIFNVNTLGALRVTQAGLARMRRGGEKRLILVSSLWGRLSGPLVSSYAASKHALEAAVDSLRRETAGTGIRISVVEPGVIKTKMFTNQTAEVLQKIDALHSDERRLYLKLYRNYLKLFEKSEKTAITAEQCVDRIIKVLDARRPRPRYLVGLDARLLVPLSEWISDKALDRLFGSLTK